MICRKCKIDKPMVAEFAWTAGKPHLRCKACEWLDAQPMPRIVPRQPIPIAPALVYVFDQIDQLRASNRRPAGTTQET